MNINIDEGAARVHARLLNTGDRLPYRLMPRIKRKKGSSKPKKRRSTKRVKKVKGKGLLGAIVKGAITAAKTGARAGMKLARNPNTWKKLGRVAITQGASAAASEAVNKIVARQKRETPP